MSLLLFLIAVIEGHNMGDSQIAKNIETLKKNIEEARAKLKLAEQQQGLSWFSVKWRVASFR
jgi:heme oxygenase